jgi:hypothetical protein
MMGSKEEAIFSPKKREEAISVVDNPVCAYCRAKSASGSQQLNLCMPEGENKPD